MGELRLPIAYKDDRGAAEQILLDVANRHSGPKLEDATAAFAKLRERSRMIRDDDLRISRVGSGAES